MAVSVLIHCGLEADGVRAGGGRASVSGRAARVCAVTDGRRAEAGAQTCIFYTGAGGESPLTAYVSAPACVRRNLGCPRSPRGMNILSCMFLGTTLLRLWSVQSPVTMLNFHLVPISL